MTLSQPRIEKDLPTTPPVHSRRRTLEPHGVAVGNAKGREKRRERVTDQRRIEVIEIAGAENDQHRKDRRCDHTRDARPDLFR
jgi:hypothetical protein